MGDCNKNEIESVMKTFTFSFNGESLIVYKAVANSLNLPNNYIIKTEHEFWEIMGANANYGIEICKHAISVEKNQN